MKDYDRRQAREGEMKGMKCLRDWNEGDLFKRHLTLSGKVT